jgi:hypothetical protein
MIAHRAPLCGKCHLHGKSRRYWEARSGLPSKAGPKDGPVGLERDWCTLAAHCLGTLSEENIPISRHVTGSRSLLSGILLHYGAFEPREVFK